MPELVDEVPKLRGGRRVSAWKAPALKLARENPGVWVRCDGDHQASTGTNWKRASGPGGPLEGFEVKGSSVGAPRGRVFVYVRWVGEPDGS